MWPPRSSAAGPSSGGTLSRLMAARARRQGWSENGWNNSGSCFPEGVYLIINHLVAQKMFNPSIFLSSGSVTHRLYIFTDLTRNFI